MNRGEASTAPAGTALALRHATTCDPPSWVSVLCWRGTYKADMAPLTGGMGDSGAGPSSSMSSHATLSNLVTLAAWVLFS